jgi:hypothetical protein
MFPEAMCGVCPKGKTSRSWRMMKRKFKPGNFLEGAYRI